MRITLLTLASTALALLNLHPAIVSEDVYFDNAGMTIDRDSEAKIVGFSVTLRPSNVGCTAENFTTPSPEFKCGGSSYKFVLDKVPEYYSRYTIRISHLIEDGYVR